MYNGRYFTTVIRFVGIATLLMFSVSIRTWSQDGLYGAAAPDDAAFVRLANGNVDISLGETWVGATVIRGVEPGSVSPYRPVTPGIHQIYIGDHSVELIPRRGTYYTVVVFPSGVQLFEDRTHTRPDRAQVVLYNFSAFSPLALRTTDGATAVIGDVEYGASGVIEVNPIPVELALFHSGSTVACIGDIGLERGQSYGLFVFGDRTAPRLFVERASLVLE